MVYKYQKRSLQLHALQVSIHQLKIITCMCSLWAVTQVYFYFTVNVSMEVFRNAYSINAYHCVSGSLSDRLHNNVNGQLHFFLTFLWIWLKHINLVVTHFWSLVKYTNSRKVRVLRLSLMAILPKLFIIWKKNCLNFFFAHIYSQKTTFKSRKQT